MDIKPYFKVFWAVIPARESLVSYIPAGDGKITNLFLQCKNHTAGTVPELFRKGNLPL